MPLPLSTGATCRTPSRLLQRGGGPIVLASVLAVLAACTQPQGPAFEPTPAAAPVPVLGPTERLRRSAAAAGPDAERIAERREDLAARAAALRERAAALRTEVVKPARRDRLLEAGAEPRAAAPAD